jgi:hypothetical protein
MFNDTANNNEYTNNNNLVNDTMVTIISNNNRTDIYESTCTIAPFSDTNKDETSSCKNDLCNYKNNINIYRYKFSERINELLLIFSKIHQCINNFFYIMITKF